MGADTVFISYSHDSVDHSDRVLAFANKLISMGINVELDQYHTRPQEGWPRWCELQLRPENSKFVLLICTKSYRDRVENKVPADEGRGVYWEGGIINQYIYNNKGGGRFIPVLFGGEPGDSVPIWVQDITQFRVNAFNLDDPGFQALYRELTGQPAVVKPDLGPKVPLKERTPSVPEVAAPLPDKPALSTSSSFAVSPAVVAVQRDAGTRAAIIGGGLTLCAAIAGLAIWAFRPPPQEPSKPPASVAAGPEWTPLPPSTKLINLSLTKADVFTSPKEAPASFVTSIAPGSALILEGETGSVQRATIDGKVWLKEETQYGPRFVVARSVCPSGSGTCPYDAVPAAAK